jgi:hypothetical protein
MKKYLIQGALALVASATLISCHDDSDFQTVDIATAKIEAFDQNFIEAYGNIQPGHTWGFGAASPARTRSGEGSWGEVIKPDMTNFPGYSNARVNAGNPGAYADIVAPITDREREYVMDWFSKNPGLTEQGLDIENFFVQNVGNNGHTKQGYFHSTEGGKPEEVTAQTYEGIYMDKLQIGPVASEADTQHTLDFNATNGFNKWNLIYYQNSSALQFGYHESYGNSYQWKFKCVNLKVPGDCFDDNVARYGWYVGLSYYCEKYETSEKLHVIGGDRLQYADDWVLKIVPGDQTVIPTVPPVMVESTESVPSAYYEVVNYQKVFDIGRILAEDLGSSEKLDMDFNDVVFEARIVEDITEIRAADNPSMSNYYTTSSVNLDGQDYSASSSKYANIKILAAGGTIPITVAGVDIHSAFIPEVGEKTMINTENPEMTNGTYAERDPVDLMNPNNYGDELYKFNYSDINDIEIGARYMTSVIKVMNGEEINNVPHKIRVPVTSPWPIERVDMNAAFNETFGGNDGYVQNEKVKFWQNSDPTKTNFIAGFETPAGTTWGETIIKTGTVYGGYTTVINSYPAANSSIPVVESGWTTKWTRTENDPGFLYTDNNLYIAGNPNFNDITRGSIIRIYGVYYGDFYVNAGSQNYTEFLYGQNYYTNSNEAYLEFVVNTDDEVSKLKNNGLTISGSQFTVTDVAVNLAAAPAYDIPARRGDIIWEYAPVATTWENGVSLNTNLFANAGEGTKIRVYGIGLEAGNNSWQLVLTQNTTGWPNVTGTENQTYWTKGKVQGGVEVEWTLTAAGAEAVKNNQTIVRGLNFTVYYVTIDNSEVITFTPVRGATEVYNTPTALTSEGISINNVDLTNATEVTVTVQGTESGTSSVSVNGVSATKQSARKRTRSATPVTYTATLTGDQIGSSINITGSNFTVYHVYANVTKASTGGGGDGIVLIDSDHAVDVTYIKILAGSAGSDAQKQAQDIYKQLTAGQSKIRITLMPKQDRWNYFQMHSNNTYLQNQIKGDNGGTYSQYGQGQAFTLTITITEEGLNGINSAVNNSGWYDNMFVMQGNGDITCTEFTIIP